MLQTPRERKKFVELAPLQNNLMATSERLHPLATTKPCHNTLQSFCLQPKITLATQAKNPTTPPPPLVILFSIRNTSDPIHNITTAATIITSDLNAWLQRPVRTRSPPFSPSVSTTSSQSKPSHFLSLAQTRVQEHTHTQTHASYDTIMTRRKILKLCVPKGQ